MFSQIGREIRTDTAAPSCCFQMKPFIRYIDWRHDQKEGGGGGRRTLQDHVASFLVKVLLTKQQFWCNHYAASNKQTAPAKIQFFTTLLEPLLLHVSWRTNPQIFLTQVRTELLVPPNSQKRVKMASNLTSEFRVEMPHQSGASKSASRARRVHATATTRTNSVEISGRVAKPVQSWTELFTKLLLLMCRNQWPIYSRTNLTNTVDDDQHLTHSEASKTHVPSRLASDSTAMVPAYHHWKIAGCLPWNCC